MKRVVKKVLKVLPKRRRNVTRSLRSNLPLRPSWTPRHRITLTWGSLETGRIMIEFTTKPSTLLSQLRNNSNPLVYSSLQEKFKSTPVRTTEAESQTLSSEQKSKWLSPTWTIFAKLLKSTDRPVSTLRGSSDLEWKSWIFAMKSRLLTKDLFKLVVLREARPFPPELV